ncbi:MAG TPA: FecR family protein [bacterium]|nr:FecR family protein [bacterium]HPR86509.1 FecR family protein [bacterium]
MKRSHHYRVVVVSALLVLGAAAALFALSGGIPEQKGVVTLVEGSAKKQRLAESDWHSVVKDSPVSSGERVRTFIESRAELEIARLDRIRMAPRTTIDIVKLYEESLEQRRESQIVLQSGDLWAQVGKKSETQTFTITTPVAAAAITGTTLRLSVAADSSAELKVYTGEVVLSRAATPAGPGAKGGVAPQQVPGPAEVAGPHAVSLDEWRVIVRSMQKVRVNGRGQVVQSGAFSSNDADEQSDWVRWNQQLDRLHP